MSSRSQIPDSVKIRLVAPAAVAAATGLLSPIAWSAPGDLDPAFGDVGRVLYAALGGAVRTIAADGDDVLFGGGVDYSSYYGTYEFDGFVDRLDGQGVKDALFQGFYQSSSDIVDLARQPDGKIVAVGAARDSVGREGILVVRQNPDGTLDGSFGNGGSIVLSDAGGTPQRAHALVVEPDGRITIAAQRVDQPIVVRLTAAGALDLTFATAGVYVGRRGLAIAGGIVRTAAGSYRLALHDPRTGCEVLALTSAGAIDASYGQQGIVSIVSASSGWDACAALAGDDSGALLVAGTAYEGDVRRGFVTRLGPQGGVDPSFDASAAMEGFESISALAVAGDAIFLAGQDASGAPGQAIVRLGAAGALDAGYGDAGRAWFDIPTFPDDRWSTASVRDLEVLPDGTLVAGGGTLRRPVVARYFGDAGGDSPGIVGIADQHPDSAVEASGTARILVRRVGGRSGAASVAYSTGESDVYGSSSSSARPGTDFTAVAGRLEWADGDATPKEIVVPLVADAGESTEFFMVTLSDPAGAGLGTDVALPSIRSDGYPAGLISVNGGPQINEGQNYGISVSRGDYASGSVSVTVNVTAGSATEGADYKTFTPVTVTWADGQSDAKLVTVETIEDAAVESHETFNVTLTNPTGGASLAAASSLTVTIRDDDAATGGGGGSVGGDGGGGSTGWLIAGLLGLLGFGRRRPGR